MKMLKVPLEPTKEQMESIDHNIEANRYVYNNFLTACKLKFDSTGKLPSAYDLNSLGTRFRNNCPFVKDAYSTTLNETAKRAIQACERTLGEHRKESATLFIETDILEIAGPHFPRYKKKGEFNSYTYPNHKDFSIVMDTTDDECTNKGKGTKKKKGKGQKRKIRLGKIDGPIRSYNQSTKIDGKVKTCTVNRKDMGRYYRYSASITYEDVPKSYPEPKGPIGVDVGVSNIAALSDGTVFENDHAYAKKESKFKKEHRKLSGLQPNTPEYLKQRTKLNHSYEKVSNHRKNNIEQISNHIVKNHDMIAMEDLSVEQLRSISMDRRMTKGYNDASIGELRRRICDKAES
ncbi:MAG: transposase, partial [Thermoplasmata archaeon]|nr:transposase [Thermoplasmata archaeon]